ncbi:pre-mrna splicing factor rna helicase [Fusarium albosuccineum]|uniref:RNA helicase n=1 Tax=Fusarium albosuccineum TaxID=1237068 RepID=A0A8H4LCR3_9HYPO|nr:pre-mrna splicing factor rna helicase [Fusarium albosuccineum]
MHVLVLVKCRNEFVVGVGGRCTSGTAPQTTTIDKDDSKIKKNPTTSWAFRTSPPRSSSSITTTAIPPIATIFNKYVSSIFWSIARQRRGSSHRERPLFRAAQGSTLPDWTDQDRSYCPVDPNIPVVEDVVTPEKQNHGRSGHSAGGRRTQPSAAGQTALEEVLRDTQSTPQPSGCTEESATEVLGPLSPEIGKHTLMNNPIPSLLDLNSRLHVLFGEWESKLKVACTQPRNMAAVEVATQVAEEMDVPLRSVVGAAVRFVKQVTADTRLQFMTEGLLLRELQDDLFLQKHAYIIIDEAHERTSNTDILLALLKHAISRRHDLQLVIMSATLDATKFAKYFGVDDVLEIEGRAYPVQIQYLEHATGDYYLTSLVALLYSALLPSEQKKAFGASSMRKCVVATDVGEASLTIPSTVYVVGMFLDYVLSLTTDRSRLRMFTLPERHKGTPRVMFGAEIQVCRESDGLAYNPGQLVGSGNEEAQTIISMSEQFLSPAQTGMSFQSATSRGHQQKHPRAPGVGARWGDWGLFREWKLHGRHLEKSWVQQKDWKYGIDSPIQFLIDAGDTETIGQTVTVDKSRTSPAEDDRDTKLKTLYDHLNKVKDGSRGGSRRGREGQRGGHWGGQRGHIFVGGSWW